MGGNKKRKVINMPKKNGTNIVANVVDSNQRKLGVVVRNSRGQEKTLLNPFGKSLKYSDELRNGVRLTNDGHINTDVLGKPQILTSEEVAFRKGYLQHQQDTIDAHNAVHNPEKLAKDKKRRKDYKKQRRQNGGR